MAEYRFVLFYYNHAHRLRTVSFASPIELVRWLGNNRRFIYSVELIEQED